MDLTPMPELHLLTGAYALDALDGVERAGFERHLRDCESCTAETAEFRETVAGLALRVARTPPKSLRSKVMTAASTIRPVGPNNAARQWLSLRLGLVAAAAVAVLALGAGLGEVTWQLHREAHPVQVEAAGIAAVLTDPGRREIAGTPSVGGSATLVTARGAAVFVAARLPAPPSGQAYQLWMTRQDGVITSAGLLNLTGGSAQSMMTGVTAGADVTVSVEPAGGSRQPTTPPILTLKVG